MVHPNKNRPDEGQTWILRILEKKDVAKLQNPGFRIVEKKRFCKIAKLQNPGLALKHAGFA